MKARAIPGLFLAASLAISAAAAPPAPPAPLEVRKPRVIHKVLTYIPNRLLDIFDMARLRVRVGPGYGVSLRATDYADFTAGAYHTVYVGLPGPRGRKLPRPPIGPESRTGIEVGNAVISSNMNGPGYSRTELGLGLHAGIIGADLGLDPMEIVDFLGGFFLWDPRHDDF
jgi:hypothetical protein